MVVLAASARPSVLALSDRARVRDIVERLGQIPIETVTGVPVPDWLSAALRDLLGGGRTACYRPTSAADGAWGLGERSTSDDTFFSRYDAELKQERVPFNYEPRLPSPCHRNRAHFLREVHTHPPEMSCVVDNLWPKVGIGGYDQLRVLVCDGPTLLAWVGGLREQPYSARERNCLSVLVPSLQRALALRRRLIDASLAAAGLVQALDAIGAPAFVARRDGCIDHSNTAGMDLADSGAIDVAARLREALAGRDTGSLVARLDAPGLPDRFLVVLREKQELLDCRLRAAGKQWRATPRELDVLRGVVAGDSNKEIALRLGCHEGSVERHVTALLRKARCDGRSRLVARFWTDL